MVKSIYNTLIGIVLFITCSCQKNKSYVEAQLVGLIDNIYMAHYDDSTQVRNDTLPSSRDLVLVYRIVNPYQDSIYLPRKRYNNPYSSDIIAYRSGRKLHTRNMGGATLIAPNDTAYIRFMVYCITSVKEEKELSPSYANLLSLLDLKYTLSSIDKIAGVNNIDSIAFHNDTTGIWVEYTPPGIFINYE